MSRELIFRKYRNLTVTFLTLFMLVAGLVSYVALQPAGGAYAGVQTVGDANDANYRAIVASNGTDRVKRIIYFKMEPHATGGANTPVPSSKVCEMAGMLHFAEVKLEGTLTGSAPTLVVKWQNSKDNGVTWSDVGTWTTINATVTPAAQSQTVSDIIASTAVVFGDCWRATYTMGAGGAGTFSIIGLEK